MRTETIGWIIGILIAAALVWWIYRKIKRKMRQLASTPEVQLADNVKAQYLRPDGTYAKRNRRGKEPVCAQDTFCAEAVQAAKEAGKKQDPAAMRVFIPLEQ